MTTLVAFYQDTETTNGAYAAHAKRLRAQCKAAGQKCSVVKRDYGADYLSITRGKPHFMLEMLDKYEGESLLYVDVDSELANAWVDPDLDRIGWAVKRDGRPFGHVAYLPNDDATRAFLTAWAELLDGWEGGDHSGLWVALKRTGYEWARMHGAETFVRLGVSDTEDANAARAQLDSMGWNAIVRQRLSE